MMWSAILKSVLPFVAIFMVGASVGYWVGSGEPPSVVTGAVERVSVSSEGGRIPPPEIVASEQPERVIEYRDSVVTVIDTVRVPIRIRDDFRISSTRPVSIDNGSLFRKPSIRWTSFNPETGHWETAQYHAPVNPWSSGIDVESGAFYNGAWSPYVQVKAYAGYRGIEPTVGAIVTPDLQAVSLGLRWRF